MSDAFLDSISCTQCEARSLPGIGNASSMTSIDVAGMRALGPCGLGPVRGACRLAFILENCDMGASNASSDTRNGSSGLSGSMGSGRMQKLDSVSESRDVRIGMERTRLCLAVSCDQSLESSLRVSLYRTGVVFAQNHRSHSEDRPDPTLSLRRYLDFHGVLCFLSLEWPQAFAVSQASFHRRR